MKLFDVELGKILIQPYEIIRWVKVKGKYKKQIHKFRAKYKLVNIKKQEMIG